MLTGNSTKGGDTIMPKQERKKVSLGKGYSLMDWIKLTRENPNIAGNYGKLRDIHYDELKLHNKEDDCWLGLFGKVYNVTPYMKFHPGGIDELMRGAGSNSTDLFNDIHPWVNLQGMLEKCMIGTLVGAPTPANASVATLEKSTKTISLLDVKEPMKANQNSLKPIQAYDECISKVVPLAVPLNTPEFDSYQTRDNITVVINTKWNKMRLDHIIVDKISENNSQTSHLVLFVYLPNDIVYKYVVDLPAPVNDALYLKLSTNGKVEVVLFKMLKIFWKSSKLDFKTEIVSDTNRGVNFRSCTLSSKTRVSHDTSLYTLDLPSTCKMNAPIGYHVFLKLNDDDLSVRPYTVVDNSLRHTSPSTANMSERHQIHLMIKHYSDGYLTSQLEKLEKGACLKVSNFAGNFQLERLDDCTELIAICAGTGFTPMIRLIKYMLDSQSKNSKIQIVFFNKTTADILWFDQLTELVNSNSDRISLENILSQGELDWKYKRGRINKELLSEVLLKDLSKPLFCVCGPKPFTDLTNKILHDLNYDDNLIHLFLA